MKTRLFFLGLCCAAAAISCNNFDDTNVSRGPLTITLSKDDMATKTTLAEKTEGGLSRVWSEGDAVSVIYIETYDVPGGGINDKFVLTAGAGTTTGTFTCASSSIPMTGTAEVRILYPYTETTSDRCDQSIAVQTGKLSDLGKYDLLFGSGCFTDGSFTIYSYEKIKGRTLFLKIPKETKFFNTSSTVSIKELTLSAAEGNFLINESSTFTNLKQGASKKGNITINTSYELTNGTLQEDIYIAIMTESTNNYKFNLTLKTTSDAVYIFPFSRLDNYMYNGYIYALSTTTFTPQDL
jgi:hypothetical protein